MDSRQVGRLVPCLHREAAFCIRDARNQPWLEPPGDTQLVPSAVFRDLPDEFPSKVQFAPRVEERRQQVAKETGDQRPDQLAPLIQITSAAQDINCNDSMDEATQPATQPYQDPRRIGRNNSGLLDEELADILCILHPTSEAACEAVKLLTEVAPQHVTPNDDLTGDSDSSLGLPASMGSNVARDIALRFSSNLVNREMGFTFGRSAKYCDIPLSREEGEKNLSNIHFRVFLNAEGTLMLQDTSTNGTCVDGVRLQCEKGHRVHDLRGGRQPAKSRNGDTRMLDQGALVQVVSGKKNDEIKFMVRLPQRGEYRQAYLDNAERWVAAVNGRKSKLTALSSTSENVTGMHWNGGDEYNVTGKVGNGAFAIVYKLATKRDGAVFAAKELDKHRFMKNNVLDLKVENEMKIMKSLRHPNIVQYVGHHEHDHWLYIIMEFVPGGELSGYVSTFGPLSETNGQLVTRQVLHALHYLHKRKITHRDIKPDNLLIASSNPFVVKLSDFGLSKVVNNQDTFLKTFCGTLLYCAPEVYPDYGTYLVKEAKKRRREIVSRTSPYDQSVDMWSFGAVLFHVLANKPPVMGRGDDKGAQMLNNIMTKPIDYGPLLQRESKAPIKKLPPISKAGIAFILKLLNRDPAKRPKEEECFKDPWLAGVADTIDYEDYDEEDPLTFDDHLQALQEDALEAPRKGKASLRNEKELEDRTDARYTSKRQRVDSPMRQMSQTPEIQYPELPAEIPDDHAVDRNGLRLFGEISRNQFPSSGIFGDALTNPDVPSVTRLVENVSVNDFVTFDPDIDESSGIGEGLLAATNHLHVPPYVGSAPSLMGAEAQLGQFQMASAGEQSGTTSPSTTNPQTPQTREITPLESDQLEPTERFISDEQLASTEVNLANDIESVTSSPKRKLTRTVKDPNTGGMRPLPPLPDPIYAANIGPKGPIRKAATFNVHEDPAEASLLDLARTTDARIGNASANNPSQKTLLNTARQKHGTGNIPRRISIPDPPELATTTAADGAFVKPLPRLGKLKSMPSSFADITINLNGRMTSWGRASSNSVVYPVPTDTRVPKCGLRITFWAPGIEEKVENGADWMKVPGIQTVVSTQTSTKIWVNGVVLRRESTDEEPGFLYGKVHTGDVITIVDGPPGQCLKFNVEITYGDSARYRPPEEPFKIRKETKFYAQAKSVRETQRQEN